MRTLFQITLCTVAVGLFAVGVSTSPVLAQNEQGQSGEQEMKVKDTPGNNAKIAFKEAASAVKQQDYEAAFDSFVKSAELSEKAGLTDLHRKARSNAIKIQFQLGLQQVKKKNFEQAAERFQKGMDFAPDYPNNYFMMGYTLKQMGQPDSAITWYQRAIEVAQEAGNQDVVNKANNNLRGIYLARANQAFQSENYEQAISHLDQASKYVDGTDAELQYHYARAYVELDRYQDALNAANRGLELAQNNRELISNLNFQKGLAHKNLGNREAAIAAFKQVEVGPYTQNARYELKHNLEVDIEGDQTE